MNISPVISKTLKAYFKRKKKKNKNLSMRWLAQKLELSPSMTSMIMNGKRLPSLQILEELCQLLDIDLEQEDSLRLQILLDKKMTSDRSDLAFTKAERKIIAKDNDWELANASQFIALKDWYFFAIMQTMLLKDYDGTPQYIAKFIGLDVETVSTAIDQLVHVGLVIKNLESGQYHKAQRQTKYMSRDRNRLTLHHIANMKKVISTLEEESSLESVKDRLVTSACFSCKESDIPLMKQKISTFLKEMASTNESEGHDEVCLLLVQFLPLSQQ